MKNLCVAAVVMLGAGCHGGLDETFAAGNDNDVVYQTIVYTAADGSTQTRVLETNRAAQRSQLQRRAELGSHATSPITQALIANDSPNCDGGDLWMFDQPAQNGNQLCIYVYRGSTTSLLSTFPRGLGQNWSGAVRSFWAGRDAGYFLFTPRQEYFAPNQLQNTADPLVQAADRVHMYCTIPNGDLGCF